MVSAFLSSVTIAELKRISCGIRLRAKEKRMTCNTPKITVVSLLLLVTACSEQSSQLESIANQLNDVANRCVADVRDRHIKYESSENCRSLTRIAHQYISAGGLKDSAPVRADRVAERARARAWMALAISRTGDPSLSIW